MAMVLYGECVGSTGSAPVRISDLRQISCRLEADGQPSDLNGECSLWIGAIGPFEAITTTTSPGRSAALFKRPLPDKILAHFRA